MNDCDAMGSPSLNAVRPFSAKQKSKRVVTGTWFGSPICSCCLRRSDPPTKPIATFFRRAERRAVISGVTDCGNLLVGVGLKSWKGAAVHHGIE